LAEQIAKWGEPLFYPAEEADEHVPPTVLATVEQHVDYSHAREVACVPLAFRRSETAREEDSRTYERQRRDQIQAALVAERFDADASPGWQRQLVELGELCAPALQRAAALDRFPIRPLLGLSDRFEQAALSRRLVKNLAIVGGILAAVAALVFVPADFDVDASGTLKAAVEREVFASATGSIAEVSVVHGQMVTKDDVLVVLNDPELALKLQQVRGDVDATRKRLDALAVTRTERTLREAQPGDDRLPLAAEQRQLEERLSSLESQKELLEQRREALRLRSPIGGQVLTRDVESLLASRPVQRGQALLTVADVSSGWEVVADVPQRQIGHVLEAQQETGDIHLAASQRLAGDVRTTYPGRVIEIAAAAPLEPEGLENQAPSEKVRIALEGEAPAAARPGMTAAVRIHCGRRSLGYVWLHDVVATIYRWMTF
jgi:multidrug resistance efflux pump